MLADPLSSFSLIKGMEERRSTTHQSQQHEPTRRRRLILRSQNKQLLLFHNSLQQSKWMRIKPRRRRRTPPTTLIEFLKHLQGIRNNVICLNKSTLLLWKPVAVPLPSAAASGLVSSSLPFLSIHFGDRSLGLSLSVGGGGVSSEFWTVYGTFLQLLPTSH